MAKRRVPPLQFRVPSPYNENDEYVGFLNPEYFLTPGVKWAPEYRPLIRLLKSKSLPEFLPLDVLPSDLRAQLMSRRPDAIGKDRAIAHFIQERMFIEGMIPGRDQIPKKLIGDAESHFRGRKKDLSRSAIYRALARDKRRFPDHWDPKEWRKRSRV